MPSKVEAQALQLLVTLYAATDDRTKQWRALALLHGTTDEAVQHAVGQGWDRPVVSAAR